MRRHGMLFVVALPLVALLLVPVFGDDPIPVPIKRPARPPVGGTTAANAQLTDEGALKEAGLSATEAGPLIDYLKLRTLTDADQSKIGEVIARFGGDDYEERVKATEEVEKFGSAAIGPLKTAEKNTDPEIAYRARQALKRMEKVPHAAVAAAAARTLAKLKPSGAAAALIGFLPMADSDEVAEEIGAALVALAVADGKAEPALIKALDDKSVLRRSAAYVALIEGGPTTERIRIKDAFPLVKAAVAKEPDVDAKFRGMWALLLTSREKEFVPALIDLIPKLPRGRIWQLEEFLLQVAGADKPGARFGKSEESLAKAKAAWAAWWEKKGAEFDLVKFAFTPRITGHTDIIEFDPNSGRCQLITLGPDEKVKVKMGAVGVNQLSWPSDVKKLPNGNYLIAEQNGSRVTERDSTGRIVKSTSVSQPLTIDLLADGGMVVVCRNQVVQYDKAMKQVWMYSRQQYDIMGGRRLPNGDIVFVTQFNGNNQPNIYRLGAKDGKEIGKPLTLGRVQQYQSIDVVGEDKIMVCEGNRVVEYDLKTSKEGWKFDVNSASSCQRLPNGNTLIGFLEYNGTAGRAIEVDPSGEIVWEYRSKDSLQAIRAFRR
ncbi:PQQ-binding-like beta-propeller repeat protein [Gemmata sp. G18]|uniref:PQQ-binding-like beta-propeller repeat protein n=1 Tax=Gemmata palustris TaxID=2822762 RepID=A0ABS5BKH5_9BACT|nr:PQQ-binding-like beta-propeller repeat protein [Gemmata palustris]MBP3954206.1 PQQ-binding-like beta-propeller repeat protein [Gemmata palustris]